MQKRSQKLQSLQDKKRNLKDSCAWEEEIAQLRDGGAEGTYRDTLPGLARKVGRLSEGSSRDGDPGPAGWGRKKRQLRVAFQWMLL